MITFVEFFCMLIRKLGGADALRASLKQFEMREDGTIEREWLEGRAISKSFFVDRFREHEGTRLILFL